MFRTFLRRNPGNPPTNLRHLHSQSGSSRSCDVLEQTSRLLIQLAKATDCSTYELCGLWWSSFKIQVRKHSCAIVAAVLRMCDGWNCALMFWSLGNSSVTKPDESEMILVAQSFP